jgi:hypothetical protein
MFEPRAWQRRHVTGWISTVIQTNGDNYGMAVERPPIIAAGQVIDTGPNLEEAQHRADALVAAWGAHDCRCPSWEPCQLPTWWQQR